jgi:site-specific recombinase XerD
LIDQEEIATYNPVNAIKPPRPDEKIVNGLSSEEVRKLVDACRKGQSTHRRRDLAIVLLFLDTGIRVSELCGLTKDQWQQDQVRVFGKGRKERILPLSPATSKALWDYMAKERGKSPNERIFLNKHYRPMTRSGVQQLLDRRAEEASIRAIHPHMLRHTFALEWYRSGGPLSDLQPFLGHTKPTMSLRYGQMAGDDTEMLHRHHSPVERLGLRISEKKGKR